ncbi:MAG TPA: energy transducer TonB [Candidatus Acidoferrum sp.]|jgi:outer membrane biosynthesis protein TonB
MAFGVYSLLGSCFLDEIMKVRIDRKPALRSLALLVLEILFITFPSPTSAQASAQSPARQVKVTVKPEYSALAKRLNLNGAVRVEVQVAPDGKVKKAHVLGGHPVLAVDAEKAA